MTIVVAVSGISLPWSTAGAGPARATVAAGVDSSANRFPRTCTASRLDSDTRGIIGMETRRQPPGLPTGGRFAPSLRPEADIDLGVSQVVGSRDPVADELQGDVRDFYLRLGDDDRRLFAAITHPECSAWGLGSRQEVAEEYAEMAPFSDSDGHGDSSTVAYAVAESHRITTGDETGAPFLDMNVDSGGAIDGYSVAVTAPAALERRHIGENFDYGELTDDRSATGTAAAMAYARSFRNKATHIDRGMQDAGAIPVSADRSVYPHERVTVRGADGSPVYDGPVLDARDILPDGRYEGVGVDGEPIELSVSLGLVHAYRDSGVQRASSRTAARAVHMMDSGWVNDVDGDPDTALQEALTDLRHFADSPGH
jgi:hypothetical protein